MHHQKGNQVVIYLCVALLAFAIGSVVTYQFGTCGLENMNKCVTKACSVCNNENMAQWRSIEAELADDLNCTQAVAFYNSAHCDKAVIDDCLANDQLKIVYGFCNQSN